MDWTKVYNEICINLERNNQHAYSDYLKEAFVLGATGGEIFDIAIYRLIELTRKNLLKVDIDKVYKIVNYAISIGYLNKDFKV